MDNRLNIAFLWHMHQPVYKDPFTDFYELPWVLLHATKDYYDMAAILEEFPEIHQTFNLVPSLIEQINDYASGTARDLTLKITAKDPKDLTPHEKRFIIERFFQANWHCMIKPYDRYWELLLKRGFSATPEDVSNAVRYYKDHDFMDLQVLFNLAWIDPQTIKEHKELTDLREKGRGFTAEDKEILIKKQIEIVANVLPKYKSLISAGIAEVTTSPYFHPIMPLLCDTNSALESEPHITLPAQRFIHPEDAMAQLRMAIELHTDTFGARPKGLWPSEGSVSMEVMTLLDKTGIEWIATDEEILVHSTARDLVRDEYGNAKDTFIYRPYSINTGTKNIDIVFRDHKLSDMIGFDYAKWDPERAADNLITRLNHIGAMVSNPSEYVVNIILDGENAWETYANDGRDFLTSLYGKLTENKTLKCVTVGEFLSGESSREPLSRVFAGSWISHNFRVWIGHQEDNIAWGYIFDAREALVNFTKSTPQDESPDKKALIAQAWKTLYAAEGSDWFWWYGDIHSSANDAVFDSLFRLYIKKVYRLIGLEPPAALDIPIISEERGVVPQSRPTRFMNPVLDGEITNYFEWYSSGLIKRSGSGGAMHVSSEWRGLIDAIAYGFNSEDIFFRIDYLEELRPHLEPWSFTLNILKPNRLKISVCVEGSSVNATLHVLKDGDEWQDKGSYGDIAAASVVELKVPFALTGAEVSDEIWYFFDIESGERGFERWPSKGYLVMQRPTDEFDSEDWSV